MMGMIEEDRYVAKDGDLQFPMVVPICGNMSVKNDPISASYCNSMPLVRRGLTIFLVKCT